MRKILVGVISLTFLIGCGTMETEENCKGTWVKSHERNGSTVKAHCRN